MYLKWIKTNMIKGKIAGRSKEELCFIIGDNILFHQGGIINLKSNSKYDQMLLSSLQDPFVNWDSACFYI